MIKHPYTDKDRITCGQLAGTHAFETLQKKHFGRGVTSTLLGLSWKMWLKKVNE